MSRKVCSDTAVAFNRLFETVSSRLAEFEACVSKHSFKTWIERCTEQTSKSIHNKRSKVSTTQNTGHRIKKNMSKSKACLACCLPACWLCGFLAFGLVCRLLASAVSRLLGRRHEACMASYGFLRCRLLDFWLWRGSACGS